jgi:hypothetical protein
MEWQQYMVSGMISEEEVTAFLKSYVSILCGQTEENHNILQPEYLEIKQRLGTNTVQPA